MTELKQEHFVVDGKEYVVIVHWRHPDRGGLRKCWIDKRDLDALPFVVFEVEEFLRRYLFPGLVWVKSERGPDETHVDYPRGSHWGYLCAIADSPARRMAALADALRAWNARGRYGLM